MSRSSADSVAPPSPNATAKPANSGVAWRRVAAIARNAFREAVRDRVLYNLVVFALLLIYVELMILPGVAMMFSAFSSPALSALLTFFVFVIGHFSGDLKTLGHTMPSAFARWLFAGLYYLVPNLANYNAIAFAAHGLWPDARAVISAIAYGVVYVVVLLAATTLIFSRRNLK